MGDGGWGIGDGGLGIGDWAQSPIPNPQSPIPNPHMLFLINNLIYFQFYLLPTNIYKNFIKLILYNYDLYS